MPLETRLVTIDPKQMADVQKTLGGLAIYWRPMMQAAISRTLKPTAVKSFSDRVKDTINLKVSDIKGLISVKLPSFSRLEGTITMSKKPVPLLKYMSMAQMRRAHTLRLKKKGKQTRFRTSRVGGGVTVRIYKNKPAEVYAHAFVERSTKGGWMGLFHRHRSKGGKNPLVPRMPIRLMQGPTAKGVLRNAPGHGAPTILDEIKESLGPVLQKNVASQIDRLLRNPGSFKRFDSLVYAQ